MHRQSHDQYYDVKFGGEDKRLTDNDILELIAALNGNGNGNTHLKSLNLNKNKIGLLGVTALVTASLEALSLSQNRLNHQCIEALILSETLVSLDVSGNNLNDESLAVLVSHSKATSLNMSNNKIGPLSIAASTNNKLLTKLVLQKTLIGPLDLTPFEANRGTLQCLDIRNNIIPSLLPLSGHSTLNMLNLAGCPTIGNFFHEPNTVKYFKPLANILNLLWLNISKTGSGGRDTDIVAQFLATLQLSYLNISDTEMSALGAKALANSTTLRILITSSNYIGLSGLIALANNKNIEHLDISDNNFKRGVWNKPYVKERNEEDMQEQGTNASCIPTLMCAFAENKSLKVLNMRDHHHPEYACISDTELASLIQTNKTLLSLDISHFAYKVKGPILDAISVNNTLKVFRFNCNLDDKANQIKLSQNYDLITVKNGECSEENHEYAQNIQDRNRSIYALCILIKYRAEGTFLSITGFPGLFSHIASYLIPKEYPLLEKIDSTSLCIHSIFKQAAREQMGNKESVQGTMPPR